LGSCSRSGLLSHGSIDALIEIDHRRPSVIWPGRHSFSLPISR
jgi:hypothetical protein